MQLATLNSDIFQSAFNRLISQPVPPQTALKLRKILDQISAELKKYETARQEALQLYGSKDKNTGELLMNENNTVKFEPAQLEQFANALNQIGITDINIPTIAISELGKTATITVSDLVVLEDILVE